MILGLIFLLFGIYILTIIHFSVGENKEYLQRLRASYLGRVLPLFNKTAFNVIFILANTGSLLSLVVSKVKKAYSAEDKRLYVFETNHSTQDLTTH